MNRPREVGLTGAFAFPSEWNGYGRNGSRLSRIRGPAFRTSDTRAKVNKADPRELKFGLGM